MRLYLIGYMGCGKSTVGRKIARFAHLDFVDTDSRIEQREGASVADIITYQGEDYFRSVEHSILVDTASEDDVVVSTGGGVPAWRDNMERMNVIGSTVYLRRTAQQIASRLSPHGRQKRPKLRGLNDEELVEFMTKNMAEREPFYSKATHIIECSSYSDEEIIEIILSKLNA